MKLETFIKRPILSSVISVLIVLLGVLSLVSLPIEQYPNIAPPTVNVTTYFTGANSETILKSVITPLEEAINGVEDMMYLNSTASNTGEVTVAVVFYQGTDPDIATVNVQNRVQKAMAQLPTEVKNFGVTVEKTENSILQFFSVYSPDDSYDYSFLSNYASINIKTKMLAINGVGKFQMLGSDYSMRVWLNPEALFQHRISVDEVLNALKTQNLEAATGSIGENSDETYQYSMRYTGRLRSPEEFENIVIRSSSDGTLLRLGQVAHVELGSENYTMDGETNGHPGVNCIVYQMAGSNATKVNNEISECLAKIQEEAPNGIEIAVLSNTNDFLYASIHQVLETLRDAIFLVIIIVLIFLKDFNSTLIPFISIMVSLIGTFAFMTVAGFSINLLTLFALVLVIGTVVDDSIVVVEAVHSEFEKGETSPFKATKAAIKEVTMPVITSSLVFMAVFIPVSMMSGTSGVFYKQFGLTMAVAVGISALNALTLVPALCAMMLKPQHGPKEGEKPTFKQRYAIWFDGMFDRFGKGYVKILRNVVKAKPVVWLVALGSIVGFVWLMVSMPSGLVPTEDTGLVLVEVSTPPGSSLKTTTKIAKEYAAKVQEIEGVETVGMSSGYGFIAGGSVSAAILPIKLKHWDERDKNSSLDVIRKKLIAISKPFSKDTGSDFTVFTLPMIPGYGTNSGIDMYVQDRTGGSIGELFEVANNFVADLAKRGVYSYMAFNMDYPQWEVRVDVPKCLRFGLTPADVLNSVGTFYGGAYTTDINLYSKVYKVMVMSDPMYRNDEHSLNKSYVRTSSGQMAPLSNFVTLTKVYGPQVIKTFGKYTAINLSAIYPAGSMGDGLKIIAQCQKECLPEGYSIDYAGMCREQNSQGSLGTVLLLCVFVIFLLLAALYESVVIPFAVLLAVPLGLFGSYGVSVLFGLDNNIYLQTGVIMLIGLLAKTAILITQYAVERHEKGMAIEDAAIDAAGARFRAILMTAGTMVIGLLPLVFSLGGVGGNGNFSLGLGTIFGMLIGVVGLLFITPTLYITFQQIQDKIKNHDYDDEEDN